MQDSNADRRNLTFLSLAIIVYFSAGGYITENSIRLQVVNVSLDRTWVLFLIVWLLLFWYLLRYWQGSRDGIRGEVVKSWNKFNRRQKIQTKITSIVQRRGYNINGPISVERCTIKAGRFIVEYEYEREGDSKTSGNEGYRLYSPRVFPFYIWMAFHERSFGNHIIPYLLFGLAAILGLVSIAPELISGTPTNSTLLWL